MKCLITHRLRPTAAPTRHKIGSCGSVLKLGSYSQKGVPLSRAKSPFSSNSFTAPITSKSRTNAIQHNMQALKRIEPYSKRVLSASLLCRGRSHLTNNAARQRSFSSLQKNMTVRVPRSSPLVQTQAACAQPLRLLPSAFQTLQRATLVRSFSKSDKEHKEHDKERQEILDANRRKMFDEIEEQFSPVPQKRREAQEKKKMQMRLDMEHLRNTCCKTIQDAWDRSHPRCISNLWDQMPPEISENETLLHVCAQEPRLSEVLLEALKTEHKDLFDVNQMNKRDWTPL